MTIQAPTRFTIEVHPADPDAFGQSVAPVVRVVPEVAPAQAATVHEIVAAQPREDVPAPAAYEPGPCTCLDDEDCGADHAND